MDDKIKLKIKNEFSPHYVKKLMNMNTWDYVENYKFNYNYLLKKALEENEICPNCFHEMEYEKLQCFNCNFNFEEIGYDKEDFHVMKNFIMFINSHEKLKNQVRELLTINIDENNFVEELYKTIYFDESLNEDYKNNNLNDYLDLDERFAGKFNSSSITKSFYKYSLNSDDTEVISIDLLQYQLLLAIDEYKDINLALLSLNDVPIFLKEAVKRLIIEEGFITRNISEADFIQNEIISKISENNICLTKKALKYLNDNEWINFYVNFLYRFDFSDFSNYYMNHEGDIKDISGNYLQKHFNLAKKDLNFNYLVACLKAHSKISQEKEEFKKVLIFEMMLYCLNINPICLDMDSFQSFKPLDGDNINMLRKLKSKFGEKYFFEQFNDNWNFLGFNSNIIFKKDAWDILIESLNSFDINEVIDSVKWNFFEKFYE